MEWFVRSGHVLVHHNMTFDIFETASILAMGSNKKAKKSKNLSTVQHCRVFGNVSTFQSCVAYQSHALWPETYIQKYTCQTWQAFITKFAAPDWTRQPRHLLRKISLLRQSRTQRYTVPYSNVRCTAIIHLCDIFADSISPFPCRSPTPPPTTSTTHPPRSHPQQRRQLHANRTTAPPRFCPTRAPGRPAEGRPRAGPHCKLPRVATRDGRPGESIARRD